ncbi:hypothetical protein BC629DRAFT_730710 [Irpex lacteus]|nr:hypothetical protein BC629DRAFT_730710 [Irpex lacteus]
MKMLAVSRSFTTALYGRNFFLPLLTARSGAECISAGAMRTQAALDHDHIRHEPLVLVRSICFTMRRVIIGGVSDAHFAPRIRNTALKSAARTYIYGA